MQRGGYGYDAALALDAADGVIDGAYYGAQIVRAPSRGLGAPGGASGVGGPGGAGGGGGFYNYAREVRLPKLYVTRVSANCLSPWLLLRETGVPFELVDVDVSKGESHTPQFLGMNPVGKVPTFKDEDGTVIWESHAILRYLCQRFTQYIPEHCYPSDVALRGRIEMALDWRQTTLYPNLAKVAYPFLGFSKDKSKIAEGKAALEDDLKVLMDFFLRETPFIGGANPCIADYSIALALLYLYATDFKTPARVKEYLENLANHCPHWNEVTDSLKRYMERM